MEVKMAAEGSVFQGDAAKASKEQQQNTLLALPTQHSPHHSLGADSSDEEVGVCRPGGGAKTRAKPAVAVAAPAAAEAAAGCGATSWSGVDAAPATFAAAASAADPLGASLSYVMNLIHTPDLDAAKAVQVMHESVAFWYVMVVPCCACL